MTDRPFLGRADINQEVLCRLHPRIACRGQSCHLGMMLRDLRYGRCQIGRARAAGDDAHAKTEHGDAQMQNLTHFHGQSHGVALARGHTRRIPANANAAVPLQVAQGSLCTLPNTLAIQPRAIIAKNDNRQRFR